MTRARDVANVLSTATSLATDTETAAAISSHNTAANGHTTRGNTAGRPASPTVGDIYVNTQTGNVEVYESTGWIPVGISPDTPTSVTATNQGSSRSYNNGQASVAFSAGTLTGSSYTITSSPGSYTASGASSPITVTGLQSGTEYTYTATATNKYGTSSASSASAGVTATTVPQAPTIGTATGGPESATLTFTAGATGGSSITNYKYSTDNSTYTAFSPAQTTSPLTISGLTNGTSYSFYLKAVNTNGDSAASASSNSITPLAEGDFEFIALVNPVGVSTFTFTSIPQTYKHLQLRGILKDSEPTDNGSNVWLAYNGNYSNHGYQFRGIGTGIVQGAYTTSPNIPAIGYSACSRAADTGVWGSFIVDILDYSKTTKFKTWMSNYDQAFSTTSDTIIGMASGTYTDVAAITSLTIANQSSRNFVAGSTMALYGIKGA